MKLENKVAIVTGAAGGIGRAIALRFAQEGADIVVPDVKLDGAIKTIQAVEALGRRGIAMQVDVTKSNEVNAMVKTTLEKFGKVDILVNNAGGGDKKGGGYFHQMLEEDWDYVIAINLKGTRNCISAVINNMIERKNGRIINIASCAGIVGDPQNAHYSAAKAGIIGLTFALAKEVAQYGILVNAISPGPIATEHILNRPQTKRSMRIKEMTGLGRRGEPEEIANMALFLVSDEAKFITGQNYPVCGLRNLGGSQD